MHLFHAAEGVFPVPEIIGDVKEIIACFYPLEAPQSQPDHGNPAQKEEQSADAHRSSGNVAVVFVVVGKNGDGECPKKDNPENGHKKLEKEGQVTGYAMRFHARQFLI